MELIADEGDGENISPNACTDKQGKLHNTQDDIVILSLKLLLFTDSIFSQSFLQRVVSERGKPLRNTMSVDQSLPASPTMSPSHHPCSTTVLILVLHGGSVLGISW